MAGLTYGTTTAITITLNSLANAGVRECNAVDNGTDLFIDAMVTIMCKLAAGSPAGNKLINIYGYNCEDGTNFQDNVTGSDAAVTLRVPTALTKIRAAACPDSGGLTYKIVIPSFAAVYCGFLARKWGIVIHNDTGLAFDSSGCSASYSGIKFA